MWGDMKKWLEQSLFDLTEEQETYLLSRGVLRQEISNMGFRSWCPETACNSNENDFVRRYGSMGQKLNDLLITPLYSPTGGLIGLEGRSIDGRKTILQIRTKESKWCPIWIGLGRREMTRIWNGYDVWIVEGVFDVTTLRPLLPHSIVLGSLRANITNKQLNFLKRFVKGSVYLAFDNDETGQKSMYGFMDENNRKRKGVVEKITKSGVHCVPVRFKGGKDPNEIWQQGGYDKVRQSFINYI